MDNASLWKKIDDFKFDHPDSKFSFSDRLARENGWNEPYTKAVLGEYRRFIYLCCISSSPITPSDPVDQVWHLHLTYTESYWDDLCIKTLGRTIHHGPTKGGNSERVKFGDWYQLTFDLYKKEFNHEPPEDIWWRSERRFKEINFTRVNLHRNWVIPKPKIKGLRTAIMALLAVFAISILMSVQDDNTYGIIFILAFGALVIFLIAKKGGGKGKGKGGAAGGFFGGWFDSGCGSSGCSSGGGCGSGCGGGGCGGCGG